MIFIKCSIQSLFLLQLFCIINDSQAANVENSSLQSNRRVGTTSKLDALIKVALSSSDRPISCVEKTLTSHELLSNENLPNPIQSPRKALFPRRKKVRKAMKRWEDYKRIRDSLPKCLSGQDRDTREECQKVYQPVLEFHRIYTIMDDKDEFDRKFGGISLFPFTLENNQKLDNLISDATETLRTKEPKANKTSLRARGPNIPRFPRNVTLGCAMRGWGEYEKTAKLLHLSQDPETLNARKSELRTHYTSLKVFLPIYEKLGEVDFEREFGRIPLRPYRKQLDVLSSAAQRYIQEAESALPQ